MQTISLNNMLIMSKIEINYFCKLKLNENSEI